jgi:hypothetical protein
VDHGKVLLMCFGFGLEKVFGSGITFCGFLDIFENSEFRKFFLVILIEKELKEMLKIAILIFIQWILPHFLLKIFGRGFDLAIEGLKKAIMETFVVASDLCGKWLIDQIYIIYTQFDKLRD